MLNKIVTRKARQILRDVSEWSGGLDWSYCTKSGWDSALTVNKLASITFQGLEIYYILLTLRIDIIKDFSRKYERTLFSDVWTWSMVLISLFVLAVLAYYRIESSNALFHDERWNSKW